MHKEDLEQLLKQSWDDNQSITNLRSVAIQVERTIGNQVTKEMVYDLIASVLFIGERVRELEVRVVGGSPNEENQRRLDRIGLEVQKNKVRPDHQPVEPDYDPTEQEWKF